MEKEHQENKYRDHLASEVVKKKEICTLWRIRKTGERIVKKNEVERKWEREKVHKRLLKNKDNK